MEPDRDERIGEALESYLAARNAGAAPNRQTLLQQHPDLAPDLEACLDSLEFLASTVSLEPEPEVLDSGQEFADYEIIRPIARGGMGVVYEAFHTGLERRVALKVLSGRGLDDARSRERFLREAKTAAGLHHTNIVPIFEVGELGNVCYYAMQFIEGRSLSDWLGQLRAEGRSLTTADFRRFARLAAQAADALAYAHRRGVVHRDIKPSNLLVDEAGTLWITDFGLAFRPAEAAEQQAAEPVGTPLYMSPEQAAPGEYPIDSRTDIYSLGATLYELLTLRPMFQGQTAMSVLAQIAGDESLSPRRLNRRIPRDLEAIVRRATAKRPGDRYPDARAMAEDLGRFLRHEPIRARRVGPLGRLLRWCRRKPALAAVVAGAAVLLASVIAVSYRAVLRKRDEAIAARDLARSAAAQARANADRARANLWDALYQHARVSRLSLEPGRRWKALELIGAASRLRQDRLLRDEAIAALGITDAKFSRRLFAGQPLGLVRFCPRGRRLLCTCRDGSVKLWDLDRAEQAPAVLRPAADIDTGPFMPPRVAVDPSGQFLAMAYRQSIEAAWIDLWDLGRLELVDSIKLADGFYPRLLGFSGDPVRLVAVSRDGLCLQWALSDEAASPMPDLALDRYWAAAMGPDIDQLTTLGGSGELVVWDLRDGSQQRYATDIKSVPGKAGMVWDPTGRVLAVDRRFGIVELRRLDSPEPVQRLGGHRGPLATMAFNPNGTILATGAYDDPYLKHWDVASGELIATLSRPGLGMLSACFSPDGSLVAAGSGDGQISLYELAVPAFHRSLVGPMDEVPGRVALSPDGRRVAVGTLAGEVLVWDTASGGFPLRLDPQFQDPHLHALARRCAGLAFSDDGRRLAARYGDQSVHVWDLASQQLVGRCPAQRPRIYPPGGGPVFLPDGQAVLYATPNGRIQRWEIASGAGPETIAAASGFVTALATDVQRRLVAVCVGTHGKHRVEVFQVADGAAVADGLPLPVPGTTLDFAPGGDLIAVGDYRGTVSLLSLHGGQPVNRWSESEVAIAQVSFDPSGELLLVTGRSGLVRLRAVASGQLLAQMPGHAGGARSATFSAGRRILASCGEDKSVQVWDLDGLRRQLARLGLDWQPAVPQ